MKKDSLSNDNKQRNIVLFVVIAMTFMATLDSSIVNVALPVLSNKLNVPLAVIEWIVAGYSIVICSTLLFFGRMGDIIGKTKVFQGGTVVFTVASILCGFSSSFTLLIVCRFIQGIGASAYMANNHGIITELFPREKRGKALGVLVTAVAIGNMLGPSAGGVILSLLNWNAIFFVNVPIGIIVFLLGIKFLPASKRSPEKMDKKGAVLQFLGTTLLFVSLIASQQMGLLNPYILAGILFAFVFIVWFLMIEKKQRQPLLDPTIFKNMQFSLNLLCALTSFVCLAASSILIPFYLQNTLKLSPIQAGIFMMLSPFILAIFSPIFGGISDKVQSEKIILIGLFVMSAGFLLMSRLSEHSLIVFCAVFVSTMAVGQALFQPANNSLIMSTCPKNKLGIVGSINSLVRNLGQIVGITLSTSLLYSFMSHKVGYRVYDYIKGKDFVFVYGMRNVYLILVFLCLIGVLLTALRIFQTAKNKY